MSVSFANTWLRLPSEDWKDITDTLPAGCPPTLARETGSGALQFSVGIHSGGKPPNIDPKALERFLYHFESAQGFERTLKATSWRNECIFGLSCDYSRDSEFIRVWYCSDGENIAFITFVTDQIEGDEALKQELSDADLIVHSIRF